MNNPLGNRIHVLFKGLPDNLFIFQRLNLHSNQQSNRLKFQVGSLLHTLVLSQGDFPQHNPLNSRFLFHQNHRPLRLLSDLLPNPPLSLTVIPDRFRPLSLLWSLLISRFSFHRINLLNDRVGNRFVDRV